MNNAPNTTIAAKKSSSAARASPLVHSPPIHTAPVPRSSAGARASSGTARKKADKAARSPASTPTVASPNVTPTKQPAVSPSRGGAWSSPGGAWSSPVSSNGGGARTELDPAVRCDRCPEQLEKNSAPAGKRVAFASCKDLTCPGGAIILFWSPDCVFCCRTIKDGTVSYSLDRGRGGHANAHFANCLKDVHPGTQDSAVAVTASQNDIGRHCYNCRRDDSTIKDGDVVIDHSKDPIHFACASKSRKLFLAEIVIKQDERHAKYGAKVKLEEEKNASKRKAVSIALLDSDSD